MLANCDMTPNRYGRWAQARQLVRKIQGTLAAGGIVTVATYTQATHYRKQHIDLFKATRSGAYVLRGKRWECIDYCAFRFTS